MTVFRKELRAGAAALLVWAAALNKGVQAAGGLVQDVQPGPVLHGAHDGHLFSIAPMDLHKFKDGVDPRQVVRLLTLSAEGMLAETPCPS